jgi:GNAT superfamily N-acetyltransferase
VIVDFFKLLPPGQAQAVSDIQHIFFESSLRKKFGNECEKETFLKNWTSYYFENPTNQIWLWQNENGMTQSYLMGCQDSAAAAKFYETRILSYLLFQDLFEQFPAHLHINTSPALRGQGVGSKLIRHYLEQLKKIGIKGVHLITSPDAANVDFYKRNGFNYSCLRGWRDSELLFLGQELAPA